MKKPKSQKIQKIKAKKLSKEQLSDIVEKEARGELDCEIAGGDSVFIFIGGCVTKVVGTEVYAYPQGKPTKLFEDNYETTNKN